MYDLKALYEAESVQDAVVCVWSTPRPRSSPAVPTCWCRCGGQAGRQGESPSTASTLCGESPWMRRENIRIGSLPASPYHARPHHPEVHQCLGEAVDKVGGPQIEISAPSRRQHLQRERDERNSATAAHGEGHRRADRKKRYPPFAHQNFYIRAGQVDIRATAFGPVPMRCPSAAAAAPRINPFDTYDGGRVLTRRAQRYPRA